MVIKLLDVKSHLQIMNVIVDDIGNWQDNLTSKLSSYLSLEGWKYDYLNDILEIISSNGSIPTNITDFGQVNNIDYSMG